MRAWPATGRAAWWALPAVITLLLAACSDEDAASTAATAVARVNAPSTATAAAASKAVSPSPTPVAVRYLCDEGKTFEARVFLKPAERAIVIVGGRTLDLPQVRSASGIRYSDGTLVYHAKGDDAFIEESGVLTYRNCRAQ